MVNKPRRKGTYAETALAIYLRDHGWPSAERRTLKGGKDEGDITGCPGLVFEMKYANGGLRMAKWLAETGIERLNAGADHGILVIKPGGMGTLNVARWYAVMDYLGHESLRAQCRTNTGHELVSASEPITYDALAIPLRLHHQTELFTGTNVLGAATMVPPGAKGQPIRYYRVMYLQDILRTLRIAGYGDPVPTKGVDHEEGAGLDLKS